MLSSLLSYARRADRPIERRVFEAWSITIPASFSETFVEEGSYWHAWTTDRSISLTSIVLTDRRGRAAPLDEIWRQLGRGGVLPDGEPIDELPPGSVGRCVLADAIQPAVAFKVLCGMLVADSRVLIASITSDDLGWARETWLSIRGHATSSATHARSRRRRPSR